MKKILSDEVSTRIATGRFYATLDNMYDVHKDTGHYFYGTARSDCGPQHFAI